MDKRLKRFGVGVLIALFTVVVYLDCLAAADDYCSYIGMEPGCVSVAPVVATVILVALTVGLIMLGFYLLKRLPGEMAHLRDELARLGVWR